MKHTTPQNQKNTTKKHNLKKERKSPLISSPFFSLVLFPIATSGVEESSPTHQEPEF
jgi:hypothetical protein